MRGNTPLLNSAKAKNYKINVKMKIGETTKKYCRQHVSHIINESNKGTKVNIGILEQEGKAARLKYLLFNPGDIPIENIQYSFRKAPSIKLEDACWSKTKKEKTVTFANLYFISFLEKHQKTKKKYKTIRKHTIKFKVYIIDLMITILMQRKLQTGTST